MTSSAAIAREHSKASKRLMKSVKSKGEARKVLIQAGILTKNGEKLTKPYR